MSISTAFFPDQQLAIVEQWDRLQTVDLERQNRLGVAGGVNQNQQIIRKERLGPRI